ncbi:Plasmodium exported protein (PHISTa), unknown function [Plasmodium reichenowi]|uniref:Plasmodium RESA N-terminal domain-containing protein n=1 Tax=Plasmodium reichenowi TaxID=5854 RepID=A0A060S0U3_PLARE|nr:Plasmodium exported protein (PHISTa), unknown function [Plasmodium reichenowi]
MEEENDLNPFVLKYILVIILGVICAEFCVMIIHIMNSRVNPRGVWPNETLHHVLPSIRITSAKRRRINYDDEDAYDEPHNNHNSTNNRNCNNAENILNSIDLIFNRIMQNIKDRSYNEYPSLQNVVDYNDLSRNLSRDELNAVLRSLNDDTPRNDLISIWNHVVRINRDGMVDIINSILLYVNNFIRNYKNGKLDVKEVLEELKINEKSLRLFKTCSLKEISSSDFKYNNDFYTLLNNEKKIEDLKSLINSYMKFADDTKKKIYHNYIKQFKESFEKYIEKKNNSPYKSTE